MVEQQEDMVGTIPTHEGTFSRLASVVGDASASLGFIWVVSILYLIDESATQAAKPYRWIVAKVSDNWGWVNLSTKAKENGANIVAPGGFDMGTPGGLLSAFYVAWIKEAYGVRPKSSSDWPKIEVFFNALFRSKTAATKFLKALVEGDFIRVGSIDDTGTPTERLADASSIMERKAPKGLNPLNGKNGLTIDPKWFQEDSIADGCESIHDLMKAAHLAGICKTKKGGKTVHQADPADYL